MGRNPIMGKWNPTMDITFLALDHHAHSSAVFLHSQPPEGYLTVRQVVEGFYGFRRGLEAIEGLIQSRLRQSVAEID
jgi:hypothetical protein